MTSSSTIIETILSNFHFEEVEKPGSRYPKFGKAGKKDYLFTCKRCGISSEPMKFDHDIRYRVGSHLAKIVILLLYLILMIHQTKNNNHHQNRYEFY